MKIKDGWEMIKSIRIILILLVMLPAQKCAVEYEELPKELCKTEEWLGDGYFDGHNCY